MKCIQLDEMYPATLKRIQQNSNVSSNTESYQVQLKRIQSDRKVSRRTFGHSQAKTHESLSQCIITEPRSVKGRQRRAADPPDVPMSRCV